MKSVETEIGIEKMDDWYNVSFDLIKNYGGYYLFIDILQTGAFLKEKFGTMKAVLETVYPDHKWDPSQFQRKVSWVLSLSNLFIYQGKNPMVAPESSRTCFPETKVVD